MTAIAMTAAADAMATAIATGFLLRFLLLCGCALFTLYGASRIAERAENGAIPVSISGIENEIPMIVLDGGHEASTKT